VRPFSGDGVRVTIGTPAENDRFLSALAEVVGSNVPNT
jgi:histidinol-phosphate aminotransferase